MAFCTNCGMELLDDFEFCPECGTIVSNEVGMVNKAQVDFGGYRGKTKICKKCGDEMPEDAFYCLNCGNSFDDQHIEFETNKQHINMQTGIWKSKWIALVLCVFLGWLGIHRFYEGKIFTGIIYLFTFGIFGIGWIIDIIRIALKPNPYRTK